MRRKGCSGESGSVGSLEGRHAEPLGDGGAVASVAVQQLQHRGGLPELGDRLHRGGIVDRVDEPHAAAVRERVRCAGERLVDHPGDPHSWLSMAAALTWRRPY